MKGIAPIRRTAQYLDNCGLVFKVGLTQGIVTGQKMKTSLYQNRVKIMTVNFNEASEDSRQDHHSGARDFVFWNLPQV